jgi:RimJ/RimL family protein N-acetyltransferase
MTVLLQTERLTLRRFRLDDIDNIARLNSDPEVMRYIGDGATDDRAAIEKRLPRLMNQYEHYPGLGSWATELTLTNQFVGWLALKYIPKTVEVEIGYRLMRSAWGHGFATEGARALLAYGFNDVGLHRIVAVANVANHASQNVLKKIGFCDCGIRHYYDRDVAYFVGERLANT